jgi:SAM-dependent methyltransferase
MPDEGVNVDRLYGAGSLDELRDEYDRIATLYDDDLHDWLGPPQVAQATLRHVPRDSVILDVGAGTGQLGVLLAAAGYDRVDGQDISAGMLAEAERTGVYRELTLGTLGERLDYTDGAYDAIVASGVLTTGHAPASCLPELARITRGSGLILFTLREDEPVVGYAEAMRALVDDGTWELVERGEPFASMPRAHPAVRNRVWVYGVL